MVFPWDFILLKILQFGHIVEGLMLLIQFHRLEIWVHNYSSVVKNFMHL